MSLEVNGKNKRMFDGEEWDKGEVIQGKVGEKKIR